MSEISPLIFKPSLNHRIFAVLLCIGSWMVGILGLITLVDHMPKLIFTIRQSKLLGEPIWWTWISIIALVIGCLLCILMLSMSILGSFLIENTTIIVDKIGIKVSYKFLPRKIANYFGAGYIPWNKATRLEKRGVFFVLYGEKMFITGINSSSFCCSSSSIKFIMVHELERLILTILEHSHNITFL
jgi:hypothetical protein